MTSKFPKCVLAIAAALLTTAVIAAANPVCAWAQAGTTPAAPSGTLPAAPSAAPTGAAPAIVAPGGRGTKVGTINMEYAIGGTNEGQRDLEALRKKFEPKQNELKAQNEELQGLQEQLQKQGDKLNPEARATLVSQVETKKKSFDRAVQDAQEDAQNQQKEIFGRIFQKVEPVILKYAQDNGLGLIVDTSTPWPQSPVLWAGEGVDITKSIIDLYNTQSGVPAPTPAAQGATTKPASARPAPKSTAPATSQQPK
jgi:outer membrane protein